jgi:hypothetical protein
MRRRTLKRWSAVALLIAGASVLGATVLREPIAYAAQAADANIISPLDAEGNVRVHEAGTARVSVESSATDPVSVSNVDNPLQPVD